jgi:hypothetical protein
VGRDLAEKHTGRNSLDPELLERRSKLVLAHQQLQPSSDPSLGVVPDGGNATRGLASIVSLPERKLPSGRTLEMQSAPELLGIPGLPDPWDGQGPADGTQQKKKNSLFVNTVNGIIAGRRARDKSEEPETEECLDRFGNIITGSGPDRPMHSPIDFSEGASASTFASTRTSISTHDGLSPDRPRLSRNATASSYARASAEIVDLRLFDFALPKSKAKIEITYIEVNMSTTSPRKTVDMLRSFDEEETTNQEQIVLRPDQVKKIHIHCPEYQDLPIIPDAFS